MTYPVTPPRHAPVRTAQVTRTGAVLLNRVAELGAVHACELAGHEDEVHALLQQQLLLCRMTRLGQVLSLSVGGSQHLGLSRRDLTSPHVAASLVYGRAALGFAAQAGYHRVREVNQHTTEVSDGHRRSWLYANGKVNTPTHILVDKVVTAARPHALTGGVIVVADSIEAFKRCTSEYTQYWQLPFTAMADHLAPIQPHW